MRVLGHEINNSLAPIKSIAGSLATLIRRPELPGDWRDDAARGREEDDESLVLDVRKLHRLAFAPCATQSPTA